MIDVNIGRSDELFAGIRSAPQPGFDRALPLILELNGYLAGRDEQFLAGVAAVSVRIDPMRPILALVRNIGYGYAFG